MKTGDLKTVVLCWMRGEDQNLNLLRGTEVFTN